VGTSEVNQIRGVEPELQPYWDWRAAGNFIFGGAGAGLIFFAGLAGHQDELWPAGSRLLGLALVGAGLGCVFIELGRPLRALNVFLRPQTSWMSREAIAASLLIPIGFAAIMLRNPPLAWLAEALALFFLYCQGRVLKAAKGIPAFREPAIVPLIFLTGLVEGCALLLIASAIFAGTPAWLVAAVALVVACRWPAWRRYRSHLCTPGIAPKATAEILNAIDRPLRVAGHAVPLALLAIAFGVPAATSAWTAAIGAGLALAAGWYLKFALIARASFNQGFAIPHAPARSPGYSRPGAKPGWT
jgi:phenylacetyl-CoA:acceptor oxidoreductase subunit 2